MATKALLQILVKSRDGIKSGATKIADVVTEYLNTTGATTISPAERFTINKEFSEFAPSNVVGDIFGDFQGLQDDAGDVVTNLPRGFGLRAGDSTTTPGTDKVSEKVGKKLTGQETFGEIEAMQTPQTMPTTTVNEKLGLGSLDKRFYGYNKDGSKIKAPVYMEDINAQDLPIDRSRVKNSIDRSNAAEFIKNMRNEGISNIDIAGVRRVPGDQQKETAELVLQKRNMGADTVVKEEFFDEFTELKNTKGPKFFKEEFQGYDSYGDLMNGEGTRARNAIADDLEGLGVDEETAMSLLRNANDVARRNPNDPEAWIAAMKQDLEIENIGYDMKFWENYFNEFMDISTPTKTRFRYGGLV
tara:strand:- start:776 stop:1849 length:1074 start_codon:yes stop_codon:yes gene_type:complete